MICLRCGYCCINLSVVIIHPDFIQEELCVDDLPEEAFKLKLDGEVCDYLTFKNNKAICKIHHLNWFKYTPCHEYTQIAPTKDYNCRMGEHLLKENISVFKFVKESGKK